MQKRSLLKVFLYTTLSLGVYELIWLYQTRQELTRLSSVRIPSIRWLVLLNALQLSGIILGIVLAFMIFGTDKSTPVSQSCWSNYVIATAPETAGQTTLSGACRNQVEKSFAASNREDKLIKGYLVVIVLLIVSRLGYPRWLRNYALAVQQVTQGKLSQTTTMFILVLAPAYGMVAVQNVFNNMGALGSDVLPMPTSQTLYQPTENKTVHRVLSVVAICLAAVFGLFILFLIAVSYYGTH